jgi:hypothetical protein
MHSWLVKGDLPAEGKEKAATKLFELDVNKNKSATKKAKTGSALGFAMPSASARGSARVQPGTGGGAE